MNTDTPSVIAGNDDPSIDSARSFRFCAARGTLNWICAFCLTAISFPVSGLTLDFDWLLAVMGGPLLFLFALGFNFQSVWLSIASLVAFILLQRLRTAWIWCILWTATGIGFVFWATHMISIT
jgi:hypothetical protein